MELDSKHKISKKVVEVGLNMISLLSVDDKEHCFEANILLVSLFFGIEMTTVTTNYYFKKHVAWDPSPIQGSNTPFRPWIQVSRTLLSDNYFL